MPIPEEAKRETKEKYSRTRAESAWGWGAVGWGREGGEKRTGKDGDVVFWEKNDAGYAAGEFSLGRERGGRRRREGGGGEVGRGKTKKSTRNQIDNANLQPNQPKCKRHGESEGNGTERRRKQPQ